MDKPRPEIKFSPESSPTGSVETMPAQPTIATPPTPQATEQPLAAAAVKIEIAGASDEKTKPNLVTPTENGMPIDPNAVDKITSAVDEASDVAGFNKATEISNQNH